MKYRLAALGLVTLALGLPLAPAAPPGPIKNAQGQQIVNSTLILGGGRVQDSANRTVMGRLASPAVGRMTDASGAVINGSLRFNTAFRSSAEDWTLYE